MPRFSANLGFLWTDLPLPDAVRAAARAGFDAVELHWPYDVPAAALRTALLETGLPLLGLNTRRGVVAGGDVAGGENGLAALPGRSTDARAAVDLGLDYGTAVGARALHVMAGRAQGDAAQDAFVDTLTYACARAAARDMTILIEPLNPHDAPGYFLATTDHAVQIIDAVGAPNLKLMFDCYHVARVEGDVPARLSALWPMIGHIQFAGVPHRGVPDHGDLDYRALFAVIDAQGWDRPLGAEYRPDGATDDSLGWMTTLR